MLRQAFPVSNGYAPDSGPRSMPIELDFTDVTTITVDLVQEVAAAIISMPQTIYVDNSLNSNSVSITFDQTNQKITIPAFAGGNWPIITPKDAPRFVAVSENAGAPAGVKVQCQILNVPMPLTQWGPNTVTIQNVNATMTPVVAVTTDRSGTITLGGTSQVLAPANANRKRLFVQNPTDQIESLWLNYTNAASAVSNSVEIPPGQIYDTGTGPISAEVVNIVAATTGHRFICKEQ